VHKGRGEYMVADIVLVKYEGDLVTEVIIIENKLGPLTDYTIRQKQGWKKLAKGEPLEVKAGKDFAENDPGAKLFVNSKLPISKSNVKRVSGDGSVDGPFNTTTVLVDKFNKPKYIVE
jgi:hypothetical protein